MTNQERVVQRKISVLRHSEKSRHVPRTCRHLGPGRLSFYPWKAACEEHGEAGMIGLAPREIVEKVLHLSIATPSLSNHGTRMSITPDKSTHQIPI